VSTSMAIIPFALSEALQDPVLARCRHIDLEISERELLGIITL
jgi:hypothetical protein